MMTAKDAAGSEPGIPLEKLMSRHPIMASPNITVTSAAHMMAAEGIDLLPVVDRHRKLLGVISHQERWTRCGSPAARQSPERRSMS